MANTKQSGRRDPNIVAAVRREISLATRTTKNKRAYTRKQKHRVAFEYWMGVNKKHY